MREGWEPVELGKVFSRSSDRLGEHTTEPEVFSITKHAGVVPAADYFDRRIASTNLASYKWLRDKMWAYSTIHIDEGSIARNDFGRDGVVSPMYTLMRWATTDHDPRYFEFALRTPEMLVRYGDAAQGSINRRRSLNWDTFAKLQLLVPALPVQRRIVDLISRVDDAIRAADDEVESAPYSQLLESIWAEGSKRPLVDALSLERARERVLAEAGYRVLGVARSGEGFIDRGVVPGASIAYDTLTPVAADQLVYRKLTAWEGPISVADEGEAGGFVSTEFPVFTIDAQVLLPSLMRHLARSPRLWDAMKSRLQGTALRRQRLNPDRLLEVEVPAADLQTQQSQVSLLDAARQHATSAIAQASTLRQLRSNLLAVLLSGEHEIPESYDQLLDVGA